MDQFEGSEERAEIYSLGYSRSFCNYSNAYWVQCGRDGARSFEHETRIASSFQFLHIDVRDDIPTINLSFLSQKFHKLSKYLKFIMQKSDNF